MREKLLVINPGSTSTKLAVYRDGAQLWQENVEHDAALVSGFATIYAQLDMRLEVVLSTLRARGDSPSELAAVVARGGLLPPVSAGAYEVNEAMLDVLEHRPVNHHASNLGAALAYRIATPEGVKAYIYDPVTVDEMIDVVRITGLKEIRRHGQGHNLNMRAAALRYCRTAQKDYQTQNIIVAHLGGGITLSLHAGGRIVDMLSDDEAAFSPERAGGLPLFKFIRYVTDRGLDYAGTMKVLQRQGGLNSLLGLTDVRKVQERIDAGDEEAALALEAMCLSVARSIARLAVVVDGAIDRILLTGGIAYSERVTEAITRRVRFIAPVEVLPGENEMQALYEGAMRVLSGEETAHEFAE